MAILRKRKEPKEKEYIIYKYIYYKYIYKYIYTYMYLINKERIFC